MELYILHLHPHQKRLNRIHRTRILDISQIKN
jgi:hypothetical protein